MKNEQKVLLSAKVKPSTRKGIEKDAEKDDRTVSYIAAQILDNHYLTNNPAPVVKPPVKRFTPPNPREVWEYFMERNPNQMGELKRITKADSDTTTFIDFYESKGWMVGKNKMKDWKAAVRNWIKRSKDNGQTNGRKPANQTGFDRAQAAYFEEFPEEANIPAVGDADPSL